MRPIALFLGLAAALHAQTPLSAPPSTVAPTAAASDAQAAQIFAGRVAPDYPTPYAPAEPAAIRAVLARVADFIERSTPIKVVQIANDGTRTPVADLAQLSGRVGFERTDFLLTSYEWGVTYSGMLLAAEATGEARYRDYVAQRVHAIATVAQYVKSLPPPPEVEGVQRNLALRGVLSPRSLDDSGSMCAAFIKSSRAGLHPELLRPWIENYMKWIRTSQLRLADGTLARHRPHHFTLWLDDLYMSVPALAEMGALTGERAYFDDAVQQILQFSSRMFMPERGLYRHGWVQDMEPHPAFHWGRANGWAIVAMAELLSVLPEDHPGRAAVLAQYRAHAAGLAAVQGRTGLWHQLLDRNDSYLETSASAMFVYAIARGINRGWLDHLAYGPMAALGWNAVAQQVNAQGQVVGTCVGTGMGFEPMFYYYRPTSVYAAHGYGPVLLAGAEMLTLRQGKGSAAHINDASMQFAPSPSRH